ncbi:MAG: SEC-C domain-containing protein [bacterium]|nr:SEC-C domain-containing protein [Candidatus Minthenecus merdequi]
MTQKKDIFERDLLLASKQFPGLSIKGTPGKLFLKGILDIKDCDGNVAYSYSIEIHRADGYPFRFPKAYEVGGDIPIGSDWHKYEDNSLCLDVETEEVLKCRRGLSVSDFIIQELIPHLANQRYRATEGHYVNEYKHGISGVKEFYAEQMETADEQMWLKIANHVFVTKDKRRNELCYCGSGKKYKQCHERIDQRLELIGKQKVLNDFNNIGLI